MTAIDAKRIGELARALRIGPRELGVVAIRLAVSGSGAVDAKGTPAP